MAASSACLGNVKASLHTGRRLEGRQFNVGRIRFNNLSSFAPLSTGDIKRSEITKRMHGGSDHISPISENQDILESAHRPTQDGIVDSISVAGAPKASSESLLPQSPVLDIGKEERKQGGTPDLEFLIERRIFDCRFFTLMAVFGSLAGSFICFSKGCLFVIQAFREYGKCFWQGLGHGKVIVNLVEAVDVYLVGTVMLIFGMGLYELFVSSLKVNSGEVDEEQRHTTACGSNLFGLFRLSARPRWLEIHSLDELKTKLGHVIVMILLVGMFEKSKKVPVNSAMDLLAFSLSILMSSGSLFLLNQLSHGKKTA